MNTYRLLGVIFSVSMLLGKHALPQNHVVLADDKAVHSYLAQAFFDKALQKPISLRVKEAGIADVLEMIGISAGINMVIDHDIEGKVGKLNVEGQAAGKILSVMCLQNKPRLSVIKQPGSWRVMRYDEACELLKTSCREPLLNHVFLIKNVACDDILAAKVDAVWHRIAARFTEGSYCTLDAESKKLLVCATRSQMNELEKFLHEIDCPTPRVRIDALVAEVDRRYEHQLGFNWAGIYNRQNPSSKTRFVGVGSPEQGERSSVHGSLNFAKNPAQVSLPFVFAGPNFNLQHLMVELRAAEAASRAKILLNPSVLTNHGETAEIVIGNSVPIKTFVEDVVQGKVRNVQSVQYKDVGTILNVRPQVSADHSQVSLEIWVENSSIPQTDLTAQAPVIKTIRTKNKVTLSSGQTTAIGGLMLDASESSQGELPVLARIPLFGFFFRGKQQAKHNNQLLIFITPTVVA